jgi:hypothetical protein
LPFFRRFLYGPERLISCRGAAFMHGTEYAGKALRRLVYGFRLARLRTEIPSGENKKKTTRHKGVVF